MKRLLAIMVTICLLLAVVPLGISVSAESTTVTVVSADLGLANAAKVGDLAVDGVITISGAKGTHQSSVPSYYTSGSALRVYAGNTLTVTVASGYVLETIVIETISNSDKYQVGTASTVSPGTLTQTDKDTATISNINAATMVLTNGKTGNNNQIRIVSMAITYKAEGGAGGSEGGGSEGGEVVPPEGGGNEGGEVDPPEGGSNEGGETDLNAPEIAGAQPEIGKAYKLALYQGNIGKWLYADGTFGERYLNATENYNDGVDYFAELVSENVYKFFIIDGTTKKYLVFYKNASDKTAVKFDTEGNEFTFDAATNAWVTDFDSTTYYLGTYNEYATFSCSKTSYINSTNTGVEQFPANPVILKDAPAPTKGITGDCLWALTGTVLVIGGNGAMADYAKDAAAPWGTDITEVIILDGVTNVGAYAFAGCSKLVNVTVAGSVANVGENAFDACAALVKVYYDGSAEDFVNVTVAAGNDALTNATFYYIGAQAVKNGVVGDYLYIENVLQKAYQLVKYEGNYYFVNDANKVAKNTTLYMSAQFVEGTGLPADSYEFDADGKMIVKNGVIGDYLYVNHTLQKSYKLVKFEDDYYFVNGNNKLAKNTTLYITSNFLEGTGLPADSYEFDADGKMIIKNGVIGDYLYVNHTLQKSYQLVKFEDDYYFVNGNNKLAKNTTLYISANFVEGTDLSAGYYTFDENGKMMANNGIIGDYYYVDGVRQDAYQLIEFEGSYYFINDYNKLAKDKTLYLLAHFVEGTDLEEGYYTFDSDGKLVI